MIKFVIKMDIAKARADLAHIRKEVDKGAIKAIERVAITVRKIATTAIRENLALPAANIKSHFYLTRPYGTTRLVRDLVVTGSPVSIRDYSARRTTRGVTYRVSKRGRRKVYVAKGNKAFILDRYGEHVFARVEPDPPGPRKGRIRKVYGPSLPQYFVTKRIMRTLLVTAAERWPIEFAREMKYRRSRNGL